MQTAEKRGMKKGQGGYILIYATLLMVIAVAFFSANHVATSGHSLFAQRHIGRSEAEAACRALIERAHYELTQYITLKGAFPPYKEETVAGKVVREAYLDDPTVPSPSITFKSRLTSFFQSDLEYFFDAPGKSHGEAGDLELVAGKLSVRLTRFPGALPTSGDAYRIYEVRVKVRHRISGASVYLSQKLKATTGTLLGFGVFFDKDLEIGSGPSMTVQGPIFSNGNIYLMTHAGNTMTLKMATPPAGKALKEDYILSTPNHVYYYFKRAIGQNYFLQPPVNPSLHAKYRAAAQAIGDATGTETPSSQYANAANPAGVYGGLEIYPDAPLRSGSGFKVDYRPYVYYFTNAAVHGGTSKIRILRKDGSYDQLISSTNPFPAGFPIDISFVNGEKLSASGSLPAVDYKNEAYNLNSKLSVSTAWDVRWMPAPNRQNAMGIPWSYEEPEKNIKCDAGVLECQNPAVIPGVNAKFDTVYVKTGAPSQSIPIGDKDSAGKNPNHNLIEPMKGSICSNDAAGKCISTGSCDCSALRELQFMNKADIRIMCSNAVCTDVRAQKSVLVSGSLTWEDIVFIETPLSLSTLYDYRLGAAVKVLDFDVAKFKLWLGETDQIEDSAKDPDRRKDGIEVYFETQSISNQSHVRPDSIRAVRLVNGSALPVRTYNGIVMGATLSTNGRLWIQGDFNTVGKTPDSTGNIPPGNADWRTCSYAEISADVKTCMVPPAAFFSDSVGLLSKDTGSTVTDLINRPASGDVTINAAIVTGYLPSQLYPKWPNCLTKDVSGPGYSSCGESNTDLWSSPLYYFAWWFPAWRTVKNESAMTFSVKTGTNTLGSEDILYKTALSRPDNKWPAWAKNYGTIPVHIAAPYNAAYNVTGATAAINRDRGDWDYQFPAPPATNFYPPGDTAPVPAPPLPGIKWMSLYYHFFYGRSLYANRCPGTSKYVVSFDPASSVPGSGTGENPGEPGSSVNDYWACCDPSTTCRSVATGYRYAETRPLACAEDPWTDYNPCDLGTYSLDSDGFLAPPSKSTPGSDDTAFLARFPKIKFDANRDGTEEDHYQVRWSAAGWPGFTPGGLSSANAPVFINRNPWVYPCKVSTNGVRKYYHHLNGEPVVAVGGKYYFVYDGSEYNCSASSTMALSYAAYDAGNFLTPVISTKPWYTTAGEPAYGNRPVLEPLMKPNMTPVINYIQTPYKPLYVTKYSGGLENIINFQEDWRPSAGARTYNLSGVLTSPWDSEELVQLTWTGSSVASVSKAFYDTAYYQAPLRNFDYNESFLEKQPPGTPGLYSVSRQEYRDMERIDP